MNKIYKINRFLEFCFTFVTLILALYLKDFTLLLFLVFILVPFILKLKPIVTTLYLVFIFLTIFLGCMLHLYKLTNFYDAITHFIWGIISGFIAIYLLDKLKMFNDKNNLFNVIFILVFSLASSCFWEVIEYTVDNLFNMNMQRIETGVNDTMKDIIVSLLGNLLFIVDYIFEYKFKYNFIIKKYIKQLGR